MDHSVDPQVAEACVNDVIACIRQFVDGLRAQFPPPKEGRQSPGPDVSLAVPLYTRMVERGVLAHVQRAVQRQRKEWQTVEADESSALYSKPISNSNDTTDQRTALLQEIILPSLRSLTACYRILDAIPQTPQDSSSPAETAKNGKRNKPAPPRGMLSIQQYTDVACLLEFTVCVSILPLLTPYILSSMDDRIRHGLPKSLAGRIPRSCLAWGASRNQLSKGRNQDEMLLETARTVSELILLDRFRPMLLPRHISDIYGAIFQYEHNHVLSSSSHVQHSLLYQSLGLREIAASTEAPVRSHLNDATLQAKAYQTLLLQGTKTPVWLRQRVAPLLTELACTNLASIVQVFVPLQQQHGEVSTMASQRLGRTLATSSASTMHYVQGLGQQMRLLLEALFATVQSGQIPARAMAILQTIWAVLYYWPNAFVQQELIRPWQQSLLQGEDLASTTRTSSRGPTIHKTLRQIGSLCASVPPPATDPWRILQHLFQPTSGSIKFHSSIMNQLVRIASMRSVVKSLASEEARQILHWMCQATTVSTTATTTERNLPSGPTLLASAWVHALVPNGWDNAGCAYKLAVFPPEDTNTTNPKGGGNNSKSIAASLEMIGIQKSEVQGFDVLSLVEEIQRRSEVLFETCLGEEGAPVEGPKAALKSLASLQFRLLLQLYLSGSQWLSSTPSIQVEWVYQLVAIVVLPILCEKCSPEALLFGPGSATSVLGLLNSIKMILTCTKARLGQSEHVESLSVRITMVQENSTPPEVASDDDAAMIQCLNLLKHDDSVSPTDDSPATLLPLLDEKEQDDTLLSIASILLSLLIAVLELGSKLRSDDEEEALQSLLPILTVLAEFSSQDHTRIMADQGSDAGISDMSGYAVALIASRKVQDKQEAPNAAPSMMDKARAMIEEAQEDLASTQPPMRARGMVSLGRLARGYLGILKPTESKPKLIVELGAGKPSEENLIDFTIQEVLRLSIGALSDGESYVYLAAVQTIVAIGDLQPKHVLPLLGAAIVTGKVNVEEHSSSISNEQRIKLAEALMFIIRRRAAPAEYLPMLMNLMIFGSVDRIGAVRNTGTSNDDHKGLFATETDKYFVGAEEEDDSAAIRGKKEKWKEQDIRSKTGGPIFAVEEHDLVRSIRLSAIAELVSVVPPATLAPFCRLLIRLITDILRLDTSRTACRAAALLAREFYGCLLREQEKLSSLVDGNLQDRCPLQLAVAIISNEHDEDILVQMLQNHATGGGAESGKQRVNDLAVVARCQEALALREDGEDVLEAARLVDATHENGALPSILTSMLQNAPQPERVNVVAPHSLI